MSAKSSINIQLDAYQQLHAKHLTTRRENQRTFIQPLEHLNNDVQNILNVDKDAYENAKEAYHQEYNILKRVITHAASEHETKSVLPLKEIYHRRKDLAERVSTLLAETRLEAAPVETRTFWNGSIAVVYNPITGRAEWKQYWHGGIHGVFNPTAGTIEWKQALHSCVYGVFNPQSNMIEWKTNYNSGVHGVYNPSKGIVEWKSAFHTGVGGVYNPLTREVEWKTYFHGGVVGYFDYKKQCVQWIEKWRHGIGLIAWDENANTYLTTSSSGWYDNE
ncbi:unnamed protein product [Rotaria socialis]|uniref:Uncharacterized protein n=2 Tax=Rotaria socialis TaxID=392032 RepID=A0A820SDL7_9BILA|nr:unnamed protein product [Rotaria socialis]CAF3508965.1 unnamed protein product [Rotaria socialis]CAF4187388.1 unnamed protein product [Rotaria socialis]CAF4452323.1 unnamed protein product [Rotaria socialis]